MCVTEVVMVEPAGTCVLIRETRAVDFGLVDIIGL